MSLPTKPGRRRAGRIPMPQQSTRSGAVIGKRERPDSPATGVAPAAIAAAPAPPSFASPGAEPLAAPMPEVATDIVKWPSTLHDPRFAGQRAAVEAPYRRNPNGQANLTEADYRHMADAAEQMKGTLGKMIVDIPATDYVSARRFVNQLADEASGHIEKDEATRSCGRSLPGTDLSVASSHRSAGTASAASFSSPVPAPVPAAARAAEAATDVILWPSVLRDPRFATARSIVEAPYRRGPTGQAGPTAADYRSIAEAAGLMTLTLGQMAPEIPATDYLRARNFLNQLAGEAWAHVENGAGLRSRNRARTGADSSAPPRSVGTASSASFNAPLPAACECPRLLPTSSPGPRPCDPRFAAQRAIVEAPYRRSPKGQANPTAAEVSKYCRGRRADDTYSRADGDGDPRDGLPNGKELP